MKINQAEQSETSAQKIKSGYNAKRLRMAGLVLGIILSAFAIFWLPKAAAASSSRISTPSEIAAQEKFQVRLITAQKEFKQSIDAVNMDVEQKLNSSGE